MSDAEFWLQRIAELESDRARFNDERVALQRRIGELTAEIEAAREQLIQSNMAEVEARSQILPTANSSEYGK